MCAAAASTTCNSISAVHAHDKLGHVLVRCWPLRLPIRPNALVQLICKPHIWLYVSKHFLAHKMPDMGHVKSLRRLQGGLGTFCLEACLMCQTTLMKH